MVAGGEHAWGGRWKPDGSGERGREKGAGRRQWSLAASARGGGGTVEREERRGEPDGGRSCRRRVHGKVGEGQWRERERGREGVPYGGCGRRRWSRGQGQGRAARTMMDDGEDSDRRPPLAAYWRRARACTCPPPLVAARRSSPPLVAHSSPATTAAVRLPSSFLFLPTAGLF